MRSLQILHREVQVGDCRCAGDIAELVDGAILVEGLIFRWRVDEAHVIFSQILAQIFLIECMQA